MSPVREIALVLLTVWLTHVHCDDTAPGPCADGWLRFDNNTCLWVSPTRFTYLGAKLKCEQQRGQLVTLDNSDKERFLWNRLLNADDAYWMGFFKNNGRYQTFKWYNKGLTYSANYENWRPGELLGMGFPEYKCAFLINNKWSSTTNCEMSLMNIVCERKLDCPHGYYGLSCEKECHCHGRICPASTGKCLHGCQPGWVGDSCNEKRKEPKVGYYCFNTPEEGAHMLLRIDTHAVQYARLDGTMSDGKADPHCGIGTFKLDTVLSVYSRKVNMSLTSGPQCGAKRVSKTKWQWRFRLQEKDGVLSFNDLDIVVTCDLSKADSMSRETRQKVQGKMRARARRLPESKEDVSLSLVDFVTLKPLSEVLLGADVKIVLQMTVRNGSGAMLSTTLAAGVYPLNCVAYTPDGSYSRELTDKYGCPSKGSPISVMRTRIHSASTDAFPMFAFPDSSVVNIKCHYKYCFMNEYCQPCQFDQKPRYRKKRSENDSKVAKKPVYTTVNVLLDKTSHDVNAAVEMESDGEDLSPIVPLYYLNPITCSMFLLLLTVFLMLYVFFLRALKRTVDSMKEELLFHTRRQGGIAIF